MSSPDVPFPMELLFYYIFLKHKEGIDTTLTADAETKLYEYYDMSRRVIRDSVNKNFFVNSICGKFPTQLLILAGFLQNFHEAFEYVKHTADISKAEPPVLNSDFVEDLQNHLKTSQCREVDLDNINRAYTLSEYFTKTKLILSGFIETKQIDFVEFSIEEILITIRDSEVTTENAVKVEDKQMLSLTRKIISKILLNDNSCEAVLNSISQNHHLHTKLPGGHFPDRAETQLNSIMNGPRRKLF